MVTGYRLSAALNVAADLAISDLLRDGPRTVDDLAAATGTDPDTLHRLLHALATVGCTTSDRTAPSPTPSSARDCGRTCPTASDHCPGP